MMKSDKKNQLNLDQNIAKCSVVAIFFMFVFGLVLSVVGVLFSHLAISFYKYYFVLVFPILIGLLMGVGVSIGARMGRCSRQLPGFLVIAFLSIFCYALLLMLNGFAIATEPKTAVEEYQYLNDDFINPLRDAFGQSGWDQKIQEGLNTWSRLISLLPPYNEKAIASNHEYATFLEYPGFTTWDEQRKILEFNKGQNWMVWLVELLVLILVAWERTYKTVQYNYERAYSRKMRQAELGKTSIKMKTEDRLSMLNGEPMKVSGFPEKSRGATLSSPEPQRWLLGKNKEGVTEGPQIVDDTEVVKPERIEAPVSDGQTQEEERVETRTNQVEIQEQEDPATQKVEEPLYALILREYDPAQKEELIRLMVEVGQISPNKAKSLLKTPSLLKVHLTDVEVQFLTDQFNQIGAKVQAITMEQMQAIQNKQKEPGSETTPLPSKEQEVEAIPPSSTIPATRSLKDEQKYAVLLQKFDETHREEILHFLASLTGLQIERLRQAFRTPALTAKNLTKDDADQIAQQFKSLHAEASILTMNDLQKMFSRK